MANTIAHLMVAHRLYMEHPEIVDDCKAFYLGSVAPDTISSKPGCVREDKKFVHLRQDIRDADWLSENKMGIFNARINDFTNEFINGNPHPEQRAFNLGYLVHLLTDKWNHKTVRQKMLQIAVQNGIQETDRDFYHMMMNDLEALDHYLLRNNEDVRALFTDLTNTTVEYGLAGYIEKVYIEGSIQWWKNHYLPSIEKRQLMYISEKDIDEFINLAVVGIYSELLQLISLEDGLIDKERMRKELKCRIFPVDYLGAYKYTVICSNYKGKWILSKHKKRDTWETQGGHIEHGETPLEAAKRELFEESGIRDADVYPVCDYWGFNPFRCSNGMVFLAVVHSIGELPESEIQEIGMFDKLPENLTYPQTSPVLCREAEKFMKSINQ